MRLRPSRRLAAIAALSTLSLAGAGTAAATTPPSDPTDTTMAMSDDTSMGAETPAGEPTGPLCAAATMSGDSAEMPTDGASTTDTSTMDSSTMDTSTMDSSTMDTATMDTSAAGGDSMAGSPVATAASMNPLLTTLVEAVGAAGLAETLDTGGPFTVLAPINSAFDKVPPEELEAALADPSGLLTGVLTYHVIPEQLSAADLDGGTFATLQGEEVSFEMRNDTLVVNGGAAAVQCADIATANATVFLIDSVLLPPSVSSEDATAATTGTDPATSTDTESTDSESTDATSMTTETTEA